MGPIQGLYTTPSARWTALTTRDAAAASAFVYAVITTKIYCRPTCPARLARRANVVFYDAAAHAAAAGFRPCKRCRPGGDSVAATATAAGDEAGDVRAKVARAARLVREAAAKGETRNLAELARAVGLSKWHLQRVFKRLEGVTPREMAERERASGALTPTSAGADADTEISTPIDSALDMVLFDGDGGAVDWGTVDALDEGTCVVDPDWMCLGADADVERLLSDLFPELHAKEQLFYPSF